MAPQAAAASTAPLSSSEKVKVRVEMTSASSSRLEAYKCAVTLSEKWLDSKSTAQLVELFLKHYVKAKGRLPENVAPLGLATREDVAIGNEASLREVVSTSRSLKVVKAPEVTDEEPAENVLRFCHRCETAPFKLMTGLLYRVVAGRRGALERVPETERDHYRQFRDVVVSTPLPNLVAAADQVLKHATTAITRAVAAEMVKAKMFLVELPEPKRKQLLKFEGFDVLPSFDDLIQDVFGVAGHAPRSRWRRPRQDADDADVSQVFSAFFSPLTYFVRSYYSPRGDVWTRESLTALGAYLKRRLEVRPPNFRSMVVEINARDGRLTHFLRRVSGLEVVSTDFREDKSTKTLDVLLKDSNVRDVAYELRPAILFNAFSYLESDDWLKQCKLAVRDDDLGYIDQPEVVIIGPSTDLMPRVPNIRKKQNQPQLHLNKIDTAFDVFGADDDRFRDDDRSWDDDDDDDAAAAAKKRNYYDDAGREPKAWGEYEAFEGYEAVHVEEVSRHLFHVDDVGREDKYGHLCCVSFRAKGSLMTQFRTEDEVKKSRAENVVAGAVADAQRGIFHFGDEEYARALNDAQTTLNDLAAKQKAASDPLPP